MTKKLIWWWVNPSLRCSFSTNFFVFLPQFFFLVILQRKMQWAKVSTVVALYVIFQFDCVVFYKRKHGKFHKSVFVCFFTDSKLFCDIPDLSLEIWMNHLCLKIRDQLDGAKNIHWYLRQKQINLWNSLSRTRNSFWWAFSPCPVFRPSSWSMLWDVWVFTMKR